jgi:hypothetical protein
MWKYFNEVSPLAIDRVDGLFGFLFTLAPGARTTNLVSRGA